MDPSVDTSIQVSGIHFNSDPRLSEFYPHPSAAKGVIALERFLLAQREESGAYAGILECPQDAFDVLAILHVRWSELSPAEVSSVSVATAGGVQQNFREFEERLVEIQLSAGRKSKLLNTFVEANFVQLAELAGASDAPAFAVYKLAAGLLSYFHACASDSRFENPRYQTTLERELGSIAKERPDLRPLLNICITGTRDFGISSLMTFLDGMHIEAIVREENREVLKWGVVRHRRETKDFDVHVNLLSEKLRDCTQQLGWRQPFTELRQLSSRHAQMNFSDAETLDFALPFSFPVQAKDKPIFRERFFKALLPGRRDYECGICAPFNYLVEGFGDTVDNRGREAVRSLFQAFLDPACEVGDFRKFAGIRLRGMRADLINAAIDRYNEFKVGMRALGVRVFVAPGDNSEKHVATWFNGQSSEEMSDSLTVYFTRIWREPGDPAWPTAAQTISAAFSQLARSHAGFGEFDSSLIQLPDLTQFFKDLPSAERYYQGILTGAEEVPARWMWCTGQFPNDGESEADIKVPKLSLTG